MPYAVLRLYTESGPLVGAIREKRDEVEEIMRGVPGFVRYGLVEVGGGALSLTVCEDKAGTDASTAAAANWIKANLPDAKIAAPRILEGEQVYAIAGQTGRPPGPAHAALRIFSDRPPGSMLDFEDGMRDMFTSVPGFRSYWVVNHGPGGASVIVCDDKAGTDEAGRRMRELVSAKFPGFTRATPEIIEGEGVFRIDATPAAV